MADIHVGTFTANKTLNQIEITNHGLINGDTVRFTLGAANNNLPAPLVVGTWYYVLSAASNTFQVSSTSGGAVIVLTNVGTGHNDAWSPAPVTKVWVYELLSSDIKMPTYIPDLSEVNYYAQRGWELKFLGQGTLQGSKFWFLLQKQEPPNG